VERRRPDFPDQPAEYDRLASRLDGVVVRAIQDAFRVAYLIAAALSLLGAALLVPRARVVPVVAAGLVAAACTAGYAIEAHRRAPPEVVLQDPCRPRPLPSTGGITGAIQDAALRELDRAACRVGATREELALALADRKRSAAFERRYGVNPRSVSGLLGLLGG